MNIQRNMVFFFLLISYIGLSQRITYTVADSLTKFPIPYANIVLNSNSGVITNEDGNFSLPENERLDNKEIKISCIGYKTKTVLLEEIIDEKILLSPEIVRLSGVTVSNVSLDPIEIVNKAIEHLEDNYAQQHTKSDFFLRQTLNENITKVQTEKLKSNISEFTQVKLDSLTKEIPKTITKYTEVLFDFNEPSGIKSDFILNPIRIVKHEEKNQASALDSIKIDLISLLKKHLPGSTQIRFKSGLFKLGSDIDMNGDGPQNDKTDINRDKAINSSGYLGSNFINDLLYNNPDQFDFLKKPKYYEFDLKGEISYGEHSVYVISIVPKDDKAKYEGQIFIDVQDFGIHKLDVNTIAGVSEKMFGLLGIHSTMNGHSYRIYFQKLHNSQGYFPKYARVETKEELRINRNMQIKSLSDNGKEKLVSFEADINILEHYIEEASFGNPNVTKRKENKASNVGKSAVEVIYPKEYSFEIWRDYDIIEPEKTLFNFKKAGKY